MKSAAYLKINWAKAAAYQSNIRYILIGSGYAGALLNARSFRLPNPSDPLSTRPCRALMGNKAFVTLLTSISYLPGVLVLNQSLGEVRSRYRLVVMVTTSLPESARRVLRRQRITVMEVETIRPLEGKHNIHTHDMRFADTWTKLRCA